MNKKRKNVLFSILIASAAILTAATVIGKGSVLETPAEGCEHKGTVNHHERVEPTLLKSGVKEYWCCCDCHKSFEDATCTQLIDNTTTSPTDPSDGRYLPQIGERLSVTPINSGSVSSYEAPIDGLFDAVYECTRVGGALDSIAGDFEISTYSRVAFGFCSDTVWFVDFKNIWDLEPKKWYEYELVKNSEGKWDVYLSKNGGELALRGENREGNKLQTIMTFGSNTNTKYYVTNLRGVFASEITGEVVDSSLINANGKTAIPSIKYNAPEGFARVSDIDTGMTDSNPGFHGQHYSAVPLKKYSEVRFALRCTGYFLFNHGWDSNIGQPNNWFVFTLTQNNDLTWNLVAKLLDGTLVYSEDNLNAFKADNPGVYTNYALNAILFGCPSGFYASKQTGVDLIVTVTEVRGVVMEMKGDLIDSSALSANSVVTTKVDEIAGGGFASVYKATDTYGSKNFDKYFSAVDLRAYSEVYFMCNAHGWFLFDGWSRYIDANEWVSITLTNKGNGLFDVTYNTFNKEIQDANGNKYGKTLTKENISSTSVPSDCSTGALNTILTNANLYFQNGKEIHVTELRGTLA